MERNPTILYICEIKIQQYDIEIASTQNRTSTF